MCFNAEGSLGTLNGGIESLTGPLIYTNTCIFVYMYSIKRNSIPPLEIANDTWESTCMYVGLETPKGNSIPPLPSLVNP